MAAGSPAFVLHARPWRETSLLIDWFTEDQGRLTGRLQGARQVGRKARGRPLPFQCLALGLTGRGEIRTVTTVDALEPARLLTGRPLAAGFYLNELLIRTLHREEPMPELFAVYWDAVRRLEQEADTLVVTIRRFERELLDVLGVGFDWTRTAEEGLPIEADAWYAVDPALGILAPEYGVPRSMDGRVPGHVLLAIARDQGLTDAADRRFARNLMQRLLAEHAGRAPFHSRLLWQASTASPAGEATDA